MKHWIAALVLTASLAVAAPPNIILIVGDDQSWTDFGFMGHGVIRTPHLDRLAAESAVFANGYVPTSLCRASLATILTGLYAHQHLICTNDPPLGMDRDLMLPFMRNAPAMPRLLQKVGYSSLQTGKFWEGHFSNGGFTDGMTPDTKTTNVHGGPGLAIGRDTMQPIYDFVEQRSGKPFFVWYAPMLPHVPHNPPERLLRKYEAEGRDVKLARYYAMCERFDETVGQLVDYVDRKGLRDSTLIAFVIDNGWIQQTGGQPTAPIFPGRTTRGWFAPKSKLSPYDGGVRTPIMLRWPGHVKPGRYSDLVSTIDLAPTLLSAAGMKPAAGMQGLDLLDVAAGHRAKLERDAVFGEIYTHTAHDIHEPAVNLTHRWIRLQDWKLIATTGTGPAELYNVVQDPFENLNLAHGNPDLVRRLTARLDAWWSGAARTRH